MSVCVSLMDAQTVRPIFPELGKGIEGHLAGNIGYVSCALVNEGLRERRRKEGGFDLGKTERKFKSCRWGLNPQPQDHLIWQRDNPEVAGLSPSGSF